MSDKSCRTCVFSEKNTSPSSYCYRNPPTKDGFPMVSFSQWCGEYRPVDAALEPIAAD